MVDVTGFKLSPRFVKYFEGKQPEWGPLGYVTYLRTYSRPLEGGGREEFWQTAKRVVEGVYTIQKWHCEKLRLPWSEGKAQRSAQEMFTRMWEFKWLPPGRGLWMMGTPYMMKHGGAALNNCAFVSTAGGGVEPYLFMMDMSMLGCGVGFDTEGAGTFIHPDPKVSRDPFVVRDSREGWCEALEACLRSYLVAGFARRTFDYSRVRKAGEPIKGFGGVSSGSAPLERLLDVDLPKILGKYEGDTLDEVGVIDVMNAIGRCVVSGNVRRSAQIALGSKLIADAKEGQLGQERAEWSWASNNSIYSNVGMSYLWVADKTAMNGEPGYFWLDNAQKYGRMGDETYTDKHAIGTNPCSEQTLENYEMCCLVETFPSRHGSYEDFQRTLKFAYLYAKTVTLVPTHNTTTNQVMMRNRRIGTSMSGITKAFKRHGRRVMLQWMDKGYGYVRELDNVYSRWLCVPKSIKVTSVKPSGTVSLLPGEPPGIHYPYARHYWRTMRFDKDDALVAELALANYRMEVDVTDEGRVVVYFPVEEEFFDRARGDVSLWEQLEIAAQVQQYWADNQVSVTVTFKPEEAREIKAALEMYETRLKSVSFLPLEVHGYEQAPYIRCSMEQYESEVRGLRTLDLSGIVGGQERGGSGCDGETCVIGGKV